MRTGRGRLGTRTIIRRSASPVSEASMNSIQRKKNSKKCPHCGCNFTPDPRVCWRQRYCSKPACVKASRSAAQAKWLKKVENRDHFSGLSELVRIQQWRAAHPGYWRRRVRLGHYQISGALAEVVREFALQDMIDAHFSLVVGLLSHLTGSALQDEIVSEIRRLNVLGHAVLLQSVRSADQR